MPQPVCRDLADMLGKLPIGRCKMPGGFGKEVREDLVQPRNGQIFFFSVATAITIGFGLQSSDDREIVGTDTERRIAAVLELPVEHVDE